LANNAVLKVANAVLKVVMTRTNNAVLKVADAVLKVATTLSE